MERITIFTVPEGRPLEIKDMDETLPTGIQYVPISLCGNGILRLKENCQVHATIRCLSGNNTIYLDNYAFIQSLHVAEGSTCEIHFEGKKSPIIRTLSGTGKVVVHLPTGVRYNFEDCVQNRYISSVVCHRV